jgi:hypothetical protein
MQFKEVADQIDSIDDVVDQWNTIAAAADSSDRQIIHLCANRRRFIGSANYTSMCQSPPIHPITKLYIYVPIAADSSDRSSLEVATIPESPPPDRWGGKNREYRI